MAIGAAFLLFCVYFYVQFGRGAERRNALLEEIQPHGPWVERGVWTADDRSAYVISTSDGEYAQPTAYFRVDGEWHILKISCGPTCILRFEDPETDALQFRSHFELERDTFTVRTMRESTNKIRPKRRTYIFNKAADYEQALANLPFAPAAGT